MIAAMTDNLPPAEDFLPRMIALCVGCAISFLRDYEVDPKRRVALAQRMGRTMVAMVKEGARDD